MARIDRQQGYGEEQPGQDDQEQGDAVHGQQPLDAQVGYPGLAELELHVGPAVDVEGDQQPGGHGGHHHRGGHGNQLEQFGAAARQHGHQQGTRGGHHEEGG